VTAIPHDYAERVYAGVLGKLIGVYLGRPFEGWTYERIMKELGPINYYVNERRDVALRSHHLVVTDDDPDVRDHDVLGRRGRDAAEGDQQSENKGSFHGVILTPRPASAASAFRPTSG